MGPFDPAAMNGRVKIVNTECGFMDEIESLHQRSAAEGTRGEGLYDPRYMVGYLVLLNSIEQGLQHEFDKWCGLGLLSPSANAR